MSKQIGSTNSYTTTSKVDPQLHALGSVCGTYAEYAVACGTHAVYAAACIHVWVGLCSHISE